MKTQIEITNFALIYQAKSTIYGLLFAIKTVYFGTLYFIRITIITFSSNFRLNFLLFFGLFLSYILHIYSSAIFFLQMNNVEQIYLKVFFYVVCLFTTTFLPKYLYLILIFSLNNISLKTFISSVTSYNSDYESNLEKEEYIYDISAILYIEIVLAYLKSIHML